MTGVVGRMASKGNLHGSSVALPDGQAVLSVMSDHPLTIDEADPVVVVGTLVTKPRENMIGYPGTKPIIVWAAQGIPVPGVDLSGG